MTGTIPVRVSDASVRECVMYSNLVLRGEPAGQIGTALTVAISTEYDRWLAEVRADAWDEGALWALVETAAIPHEQAAFLAPGDNPYRKEEDT